MKINPYLYFNGNAIDAITLYEKVFLKKAIVAKYKDVASYDSAYQIPDGTEDFVMHSNINLGDSMLLICDVPQQMPHKFSNGLQLMLNLPNVAEVNRIFDSFKDGGEIIMQPQKTFWSECFASIKDKFGVYWLLSYENEEQQKQTYGN